MLIAWLKKRWRERQRSIDMDILWPVCVNMCEGDIGCARDAFAMHCLNDPAWSEMSDAEVYAFVAKLEAYD